MRYLLSLMITLVATVSAAQSRLPSHCIALSQGPATIQQAGITDPVPLDALRIHYIDHSMFLIQTTGGISAVTDYAGYLGPVDFTPSVVTMNNGHSTHWTFNPDPDIPFVLQGWADAEGPADHYIDLDEMLIRNVTTETRGQGGWREAGNSIFVFEAAGLCVAHLGHLHHEPTPEQYARIGRVDVVMIAVDGGLTLDVPTVLRVMDRLRAQVVLPMHWFNGRSLQSFLAEMSNSWDVEISDRPDIILGQGSLPDTPTVIVLRPQLLDNAE